MSGKVIPLFKDGDGKELPPIKSPFTSFPPGSRYDFTRKRGMVFSLDPNASPAEQDGWIAWLENLTPQLEEQKISFEVFSKNGKKWREEIPTEVRIFLKAERGIRLR